MYATALDDLRTALVFRENVEEFDTLLGEYRKAKRALVDYLRGEGFVCAVLPVRKEETASGN